MFPFVALRDDYIVYIVGYAAGWVLIVLSAF